MTSVIRIIIDPPRRASLNMAIDETLMESMAREERPVLRFYGWERPAASIGYFEDVRKVSARLRCEEKGWEVVRRITGGGIVVHGEDLTFSFSLKNPNDLLPSDVKSSYLAINEAIRLGLKNDWPAIDYADCKTVPSGRAKIERVCFEAPSCYDLLLNGKKILGASQRRRQGVMLHQSTVFLGGERERLARLILEGFEKKWSVRFVERPLSAQEMETAEKKEKERYSSPEWARLLTLKI